MEQITYDILEEWYIEDITESLFEVVSEYGYYQHFNKEDLRMIIKELEYIVTTTKHNFYEDSKGLYKEVLLSLCENNDLKSKIFD